MDATKTSQRLLLLDALRGAAIVWMVMFHLAYDLNHFGWLQPRQQFLVDPFWTWQRVCIVSLFMFCAGASQAMAHSNGVNGSRFARRWLQVAACAVLVSLATWFVFSQSWISFGVLHGLALMVLIARWTAAWKPGLLMVLAALALVAPQFVQHPMFDNRWLNGVGLVTRKPVTEDYAPLLPWMGMVWMGLALGPRLQTIKFPANRLVMKLVSVLARVGQRAQEAGVKLVDSDAAGLGQLAGRAPHQGVVARVKPMKPQHSIDDHLDEVQAHGGTPLLLVLDGVTDPHNLGAVLHGGESGPHAGRVEGAANPHHRHQRRCAEVPVRNRSERPGGLGAGC